MRKMHTVLILLFLLSMVLIISGCTGNDDDDPLKVRPVVRINEETVYNFTAVTAEFWDTPIWRSFKDNYSFKSENNLADRVVADMKSQVEDLGEDVDLFSKCLSAAMYEGSDRVPCLAEKAQFKWVPEDEQNMPRRRSRNEINFINDTPKKVWIFTFNHGHGDTDDLGHVDISVVGLEDNKIIISHGCG